MDQQWYSVVSVLLLHNNDILLLDDIPIPEVPFREDPMIGSGIGAGDGISNAGNMLTPISMSDGFSVIPNEQVGQLYAYRINDSAVVLGTRRASTFGASIGIGSVASGTYQCLAENDNTNSENVVTISINSKLINFLSLILLLASLCSIFS